MAKLFNYIVGHKLKTGEIVAHMIQNSEVQYGSMTDAKQLVQNLMLRKPDRQFKIYELIEVKEKVNKDEQS